MHSLETTSARGVVGWAMATHLRTELVLEALNAYDTALCESFFATLECELLERHRFQTRSRRAWPAGSEEAIGRPDRRRSRSHQRAACCVILD